MITKAQAEAVVSAITYRDWQFRPAVADVLSNAVNGYDGNRVYVHVRYRAADSAQPGYTFDNSFIFSFPLPETEAEVARAVFEAITVIEDHERREFFKVDTSVITDRPKDGIASVLAGVSQSPALFHPHGFNRNALFHRLDPFGEKVRDQLQAYGRPFTADAA